MSPRALATAVQLAHELAIEGPLSNLPPYTSPAFPIPESERVTLFDWMVLTCYPDEFARQQHLLDLYGDRKSPQPQERREQENMNLD
jgi:beta-1,4-N-acetylglucosaminyltransferase